MSDKYDKIIKEYCTKLLPDAPWQLIKAQVWQESRFNPMAKSPAGALGLLQIMPETAEQLGCKNSFEPKENLVSGITYLASQYMHLGEIPDATERLKFSLAAYNGGRGYINKALSLARRENGLPFSYAEWLKIGQPTGIWRFWGYTKLLLQSVECTVDNKHPDYQQMVGYVHKIFNKFQEYKEKV